MYICYDFSTWVSNRHLKFSMSETERSFFPNMYPNQLSHCSKSHHHLPSQLDSQSLEDILESVSPHYPHLIRQSLLQILHVFQISSLSSVSTTAQLIFPLVFLDHWSFLQIIAVIQLLSTHTFCPTTLVDSSPRDGSLPAMVLRKFIISTLVCTLVYKICPYELVSSCSL